MAITCRNRSFTTTKEWVVPSKSRVRTDLEVHVKESWLVSNFLW